jgi:hypothetical protein
MLASTIGASTAGVVVESYEVAAGSVVAMDDNGGCCVIAPCSRMHIVLVDLSGRRARAGN